MIRWRSHDPLQGGRDGQARFATGTCSRRACRRAVRCGRARRARSRSGSSGALEIALAIVVHLARGGGVLFMTFTMSHERGEELADVWDILTDGWSYMTSGEQWQAIKERFGIVGWIKSTEVTHGRNGWHPHLHVLVFTERPLSPLDSSDDYWNLRIVLRERWIHRFLVQVGAGRVARVRASTRSPSSPTSPAVSAST